MDFMSGGAAQPIGVDQPRWASGDPSAGDTGAPVSGGNALATIFPHSIFARMAAQDQQQQMANQTVRWLVNKAKVDPPVAAYLATNPTAMNQYLNQYFSGQGPDLKITTVNDPQTGRAETAIVDMKTGKWNPIGGTKAAKKELGAVSTDVWGNPVKEFYDPVTMKRYDLNGNPIENGPAAVPAQPPVQVNVNGQTASTSTTPANAVNSTQPVNAAASNVARTPDTGNASGEAFLKQSVPPALQDIVRKVANYQADVKALGYRGETRSRILAWASQYNPNFDEAQYTSRLNAIKEFNSGGQNSPASQIVNGNVALQHAAQLLGYSDKIGGPESGHLYSGMGNWLNKQYESAVQDPTYAQYQALMPKFIEEMTRFYKGTGGNEADIARDIDNLSIANSPESRKAALQALAHAIHSKINSLQDRYKTAMGPTGWMQSVGQMGPDFPIMQQHGQQAYQAIMGSDQPAEAAPKAAPSSNGVVDFKTYFSAPKAVPASKGPVDFRTYFGAH